MQKKLIALAVAGLVSAPVFAQSSVTAYGIVDMAVGLGKHGDNDFRGVFNGVLSGSRLGFRGSEDLGNGLKAVFTLEYSLTPDVNSGIGHANTGNLASLNSRQTFVGLQGGFGTVSLGRQYAPGYFANYDAALGAVVGPQSLLSAGSGMTITPNSPARWDNSIAYMGSFSGLTARAIYAARTIETSTSPSQDDSAGLGLDYSNGPIKVGAVYHLVKSATAGADDQREWLVGGSYDFGVLTLAGSYQRANDVRNVSGDDAKLWQLGVIVPVSGAGKVHVAYGKLKQDLAVPTDDTDATSWIVAYTHAMSKRTTAYAGFTRTSNDDAIQNFGPVAAPAGDIGEDSDLFVLGMRHAF